MGTTSEKNILPTSSIIKEELVESRSEILTFDHSKLKSVETEEKNPLPTSATLREEMMPEKLPDMSGVAKFDSSKLKHVRTEEKISLPSSDIIEQEAVESRSEVKLFDRSRLKSVET